MPDYELRKPQISKPVSQKRISYSEFILKDRDCCRRQMAALLSLHKLQLLYESKGLTDAAAPLQNTFARNSSVNTAFIVYRIKKAVLNGMPITVPDGTVFVLTEQLTQLFVLAMLRGNTQVVNYFLQNKIIRPNCSMFRSPNWPSYFLLSCTCKPAIFDVFQKSWIDQNISWFGIGVGVLCVVTRNTPVKGRDLDFVTYQQLYYLNQYREVDMLECSSGLPVFPLDFACVTGNVPELKQILENTPEAGTLSRLSFIVQSEEHIILVLSRYGFSISQQFNGNTPLHYSCYNDDFCTLSMLLYLGFPIKQNALGLYPNEVGHAKTKEKTSIFFNLCASTAPAKSTSGVPPMRVFLPDSFKKNMKKWMSLLNFQEADFDRYVGVFKYLDFNKEHRIYRKSRFSIVTAFSFSKSISSVEKVVQNLMLLSDAVPQLSEDVLEEEFAKYF